MGRDGAGCWARPLSPGRCGSHTCLGKGVRAGIQSAQQWLRRVRSSGPGRKDASLVWGSSPTHRPGHLPAPKASAVLQRGRQESGKAREGGYRPERWGDQHGQEEGAAPGQACVTVGSGVASAQGQQAGGQWPLRPAGPSVAAHCPVASGHLD